MGNEETIIYDTTNSIQETYINDIKFNKQVK